MNNNNPLQQYFRAVKHYIKLPSKGKFYEPGFIELNEHGEIGVLGMTSKDELMFKNPEALLNGDAILNAIRSCVPAVTDPRKLLTNDIDALFVAIRHATYGNKINLDAVCPECEAENVFELNSDETLEQIETLDEVYVINLENGLSIFLTPFTFDVNEKAVRSTFEQTKILRVLQNDQISDDERFKIYSQSFKKFSELNFELITDAILKIVNEQQNILVTDKGHIAEFLQNSDKDVVLLIDKQIKEMNNVGVKKQYEAHCYKCKHTWMANIDFNPDSFFAVS